MKRSFYQVNNYTTDNLWVALRKSLHTGHFAEYVDPRYSETNWSDFDVKSIMQKPASYWIERKIQYLTDNYKTRLHYSGGTDSHTLAATAKKLGVQYDDVFMYLSSVNHDWKIDWEYEVPYDWLHNNTDITKDISIFRCCEEDYEIWNDLDVAYKNPGFYHGFRPVWSSVFCRALNQDYLEVLGTDKPWLYFTKQNVYWVISDCYNYLPERTQVCDFFLDNIVPETAINQVYNTVDFAKKHGYAKPGWFIYTACNKKNQAKLNHMLGRCIPADESLAFTKHFKLQNDYGMINKKHQSALQEIYFNNRLDILEAWINTSEQLVDTFKNSKDVKIRQVNLQHLNINIDSINLVEPINRLGAIFKVNDTHLELMPFTDINLLE